MDACEICEMEQTGLAIDQVVEKLRSGDQRVLARTITAIEQGTSDRLGLLKELFPWTGRAQTVGVTGPPGAGKSSLIREMIRNYRGQSKTVAVVAVDPTSPYSGGATLGDRIRMQELAGDAGVFVRSMASRGQVGGVAPTTAEVVAILDAAGWDRIVIETVGVGQNQLDVSHICDALVVVIVPGMGDEVQAEKAGLLEAADVFAINKSDRQGMDEVERTLHESLGLGSRPDGWIPPVVPTVATSGMGVSDLIGALDSYFHFQEQNPKSKERRIDKWEARLARMVRERLEVTLLDPDFRPLFRSYATSILERRLDPYTAIDRLTGRSLDEPASSHADRSVS